MTRIYRQRSGNALSEKRVLCLLQYLSFFAFKLRHQLHPPVVLNEADMTTLTVMEETTFNEASNALDGCT